MFPRVHYLDWAMRHYGGVPFDLATSGVPTVPLEELGLPARLDDAEAKRKLVDHIGDTFALPRGEITLCNGATQAMWLAYAATLSPGDSVLVEHPAYEPLVTLAEGAGARVVRFAREPDGFAVDPAKVRAAMDERTRLVVVTHLHNPSGVATPDDAICEIARIAAARDAYVLVNEIYAPMRAPWNFTARRIAPNVLAASSLTKCFGLGPLRTGWLAAPEDVSARAAGALIATCGHLPVTHAAFGVHAFSRIEWLLARGLRDMNEKRAAVERWVKTHPELSWSAPDAGAFAFIRMRKHEDLLSRIERGIVKHEVIVAPGTFFGIDDGFRLSWALSERDLPEALARLDRVLFG